MTLQEIVKLSGSKIICCSNRLNDNITTGFASDLMSDVLTVDLNDIILITGLCHVQTIRTAEISEINYILFARGKKASADMISLAHELNIAILESHYSVFRIVGILYTAGLKPVY